MRRFYVLLSWCIFLLGLTLIVLHYNQATTVDSGYTIVVLVLASVSSLAGYLRHRPPFFVFAAVIVATFGFLAALMLEEDTETQHSIELLLFATLLIIGLALLRYFQLTQIQRRINVVVDGLIVGLGAWLVTWILLVQPALEANSQSDITVLRAIVLATAVLVIFLLSLLVFSRTNRSYSLALLALSVLSAVVGVIMRALSFRQDINFAQDEYALPFTLHWYWRHQHLSIPNPMPLQHLIRHRRAHRFSTVSPLLPWLSLLLLY